MRSRLFVTVGWILPATALMMLGCGDSPGQGNGGGADMPPGGGGQDAGGGKDGGDGGGGSDDGGAPPDLSLPGPPLTDLTHFVNPFIGTAAAPNVENPVGGGKGGSDFPGATLPWGGVQFSPDTPNADPSGYGYEATTITGFSL